MSKVCCENAWCPSHGNIGEREPLLQAPEIDMNTPATVHVALRSYAYEADEVLVVCSTNDLAERRAKQARKVYPGADVRITEYTIDGRAPWEPTYPIGKEGARTQ